MSPSAHLPPQEEAYRFAELIAEEKVRSVVINMEHAAFDQGLAQLLADHLKAPCYALSELKAESLYHAVRQEMVRPTSSKNRPSAPKDFLHGQRGISRKDQKYFRAYPRCPCTVWVLGARKFAARIGGLTTIELLFYNEPD